MVGVSLRLMGEFFCGCIPVFQNTTFYHLNEMRKKSLPVFSAET